MIIHTIILQPFRAGSGSGLGVDCQSKHGTLEVWKRILQDQIAALTGNSSVGERSDYLVAELRKVQVKLGNGYLSAFPFEHFDRLAALQNVWAPYYVVSPPLQPPLVDNDLPLVRDGLDAFVGRPLRPQ